METFAEKLKDLRLERGLTQPDLAKLIGVSNGSISFWENGLNTPRADIINKLAKALNTTPEFLLNTDTENINDTIPQDELLLLKAYRAMSPGKKKALFNMLDIDESAIAQTKITN